MFRLITLSVLTLTLLATPAFAQRVCLKTYHGQALDLTITPTCTARVNRPSVVSGHLWLGPNGASCQGKFSVPVIGACNGHPGAGEIRMTVDMSAVGGDAGEPECTPVKWFMMGTNVRTLWGGFRNAPFDNLAPSGSDLWQQIPCASLGAVEAGTISLESDAAASEVTPGRLR